MRMCKVLRTVTGTILNAREVLRLYHFVYPPKIYDNTCAPMQII